MSNEDAVSYGVGIILVIVAFAVYKLAAKRRQYQKQQRQPTDSPNGTPQPARKDKILRWFGKLVLVFTVALAIVFVLYAYKTMFGVERTAKRQRIDRTSVAYANRVAEEAYETNTVTAPTNGFSEPIYVGGKRFSVVQYDDLIMALDENLGQPKDMPKGGLIDLHKKSPEVLQFRSATARPQQVDVYFLHRNTSL